VPQGGEQLNYLRIRSELLFLSVT